MTESKHVYRTLDGLRGIAALAIVMFHTQSAWGVRVMPHAYLAVDMFFVISGIVIAHAYEHRFAAGMTPAQFMRLRLIRIYPLYLLGTVVAMAAILIALASGIDLVGWKADNFATAALPALFMLPSYRAGDLSVLYPLNLPAWSLLFELLVNFCYVVLFARLTDRVLLAVVGVSALMLAAMAIAAPDLNLGSNWATLSEGLPRVFESFPLGVLIYRARGRLPKLSAPPALLGMATLAVFATDLPGGLASAWDLLAIILLMPTICLAAITSEPRRCAQLCLWLGTISYPVYMLHIGLFRIVERSAERLFGSGADRLAPWAGLLFLVFVTAAATVADRVYDRPVRRFLGRRFPASAAVAAAD